MMDWRGGFVNCQPVFEQQSVVTLKEKSTHILVTTMKVAYDNFYKNVFRGSANTNEHKELAMVFLNGLFCYLRGVGKLKDEQFNNTLLPHFIADPILNALLESTRAQDDLICLFCAQANLSLTNLSISPQVKIEPVIFEAFTRFNIQTVDVSNCDFVNGQTILNLTQSESLQKSLVSLKIRGCKNVAFLPNLSPLRRLATLDISEIYGLEMTGYQNYALLDKLCLLLIQLPNLKNLATYSNGLLENTDCLLVNANPQIWYNEVLKKSKIEFLDISINSNYQLLISTSSVAEFLNYIVLLPNLESLDISGWYITGQSFYNVFSHRKAFSFLGLINVPAMIESQYFCKNVAHFSKTVASLSTFGQILNSLKANLEKPQFLNIILREIRSWLAKNNFIVDREFLEYFIEALIKILNYFQPGSPSSQFAVYEGVFDNLISCLSLITTQFNGDFTNTLRTRLMKNCFVLYQSLPFDLIETYAQELTNMVTTLITAEDLKSEEFFPFYFAVITFTLNVMRICTNIGHFQRFTSRAHAQLRTMKQHSEFLNMFTIEMPRKYLARIAIDHGGVTIIAKQIHSALHLADIIGVHQFENLWGALRNLLYLCPENSYEFLTFVGRIMNIGYDYARRKQWQEVINLIHQCLENVIECWNLNMISISDIPILNCIEGFLVNKINYFDNTDDQYICTLSTIIIYLARMFERSNKILPEYLRVGLELVAENLTQCNLVCRVKRRSLRALIDCTYSIDKCIVICARWLINNYLQEDWEYYSKFVRVEDVQPMSEVIIIDD